MIKQPKTISVTINRQRVTLEAPQGQDIEWCAALPGGGWIRIERGSEFETKWAAVVNPTGRDASDELRGYSALSAQGAVNNIKKKVRAAAKLFGLTQ